MEMPRPCSQRMISGRTTWRYKKPNKRKEVYSAFLKGMRIRWCPSINVALGTASFQFRNEQFFARSSLGSRAFCGGNLQFYPPLAG